MTYPTPNTTVSERMITLNMSVMQAAYVLKCLENGTSETSSEHAHIMMTIDELKSELLKG